MTTLDCHDVATLGGRLEADGYAVIPGVVSRERLTAFNAEVLDAFSRAERFRGGGSISGHLNCYPGEAARFIYDAIEAHGIADAVRALRPGRPNDVRASLNLNLPGSVAQHYHMDGTYLDEFVICNVAVVDADLENGAIDVLPSTNREFYPYWRYVVTRRRRLTTRVPLRQGDLLIRKSTLWHRGMPNRTSAPRAMAAVTFGEKGAPAGDPFAEMDGAISFYPNWFSAGRLGALRERAEVAAPITRSAYRFVTSLTGRRGYASY